MNKTKKIFSIIGLCAFGVSLLVPISIIAHYSYNINTIKLTLAVHPTNDLEPKLWTQGPSIKINKSYVISIQNAFLYSYKDDSSLPIRYYADYTLDSPSSSQIQSQHDYQVHEGFQYNVLVGNSVAEYLVY